MNELNEKLNDYIEKLPKRAVINLMLTALDEMQGYNGQSQTSAICHALGAEEIHTEKGTRWKLPAIGATKKIFG
jgi:hypothetical protein